MEPRTGMGEPLRDPGSSNEQHQHAAERRGAPSGSPRQPAGGSGRVGAATAAASSPGPLGSSSWPSSLAFSWVSPLLHRGSTQVQLHQQDLFDLPQDLLPATCRRRLLRHWHDEQQRANLRGGGAAGLPAPSLLRAIVAAYGWPYLLLGLLKAAGDALNFAGPLLLNLLLRHLAGSGGSNSSATLGVAGWQVNMVAPLFGYCCVALLAASLVLKAFLGAHYGYRQALVASQLRSAVTAAVFRKALAVNAATLAATGSGRVQTLMSVDAERLVTLCLSFHELWSLPVQIVVALWMLYTQVQCAFLAGLALVLLLIPLNHWLAKRIQEASIQMMAAKDRRVRAMMEILRGIRQIKCYAWEGAFAARVVGERRAELAALAVCKYMDALCVYFWAAISLLFSLTTFGLYALMGHQLTPQAVFTSLALFNVLLAPINAFPWVINGVVEAVVSVRRLSEFLRAPETVGPSSPASSSQVTQGAAISVASSFAWSSNRSSSSVDSKHSMAADQHQQRSPGGGAVLQDMALVVPAGALVALTGPVGSGKSSLLAAVLGEMLPAGPGQPQSGDKEGSGSRGGCVAAGSSVAYVPQEPWIMHGTLRDNVLLGQPYDGQRYTAVLHACALLPDLQDMPAGDMTMVGGAGATLSGGQRARLALARALYKDPSVLLLDDCLAAVDARVAGWILRHALLGPLLWGEQDGMQQERGKEQQRLRTAVVATHTPALLAVADMVVELRGGRVAAVRLQPEAAALRRQEVVTAAAAAAEEEGSPASRAPAHMEATPGTFDTAGDEERLEVQGGAAGEERVREQAQPPQEEEERQQGHVRWGVYQRYVAATGWGWATVILLSMLFMQTTRNGNDLWLSHWVSQVLHPNSTSNQPRQPQLPWCSHASPAPGVPPPACMPGIPLIDLSSHSSGSGSGSDSSGWGTSSSWNRNSTSSTSGGYSSMSSSLLFSSGNGLDPTVRYYLSVLLAIATANSVVTLVRAFSFAKGGLVAAKRVHEQLLAAVLALPLAFFDATPPGRILNRFSSDTATVDDSLPFILNIALASCFSLAGVAVVLCLTQPLVLVLLPLLALAYRRLQLYYRATSRELRRLDAVAKSPVYTAFSEALSGGPTIRAFGAQAPFLAAAEAAVAAQQRASVSSAAAGSWLGLRLQLMAAALAVAVAGAAVAERAGSLPPFLADGGLRGGGGRSGRSGMAAGLVGLSLSYVLPITGLLSGLLASSAETEQEMVAAERVFQYLELGGKGCSGGSSGRRDRTCRPLPKQAAVSVRQKAASSEGSDIEAQQPLLQQPLRSPLAADRLRNCGVSSSSSSDCWLHSGHVSFEDVWLCYEPWSSGGSSAAASSSCDGAVGFIDSGSDSSSGGSGASGTAPSKGPAPDDSSSSCGSSSPWVLRGVTLDVQAGSHVGICGRTGAGKSSLLAALLRLAPIARGKVSIDGHNIAAIPVQDLRRAVGVVPQHPFLFEGSVWQNLDPLGRHTTAELAAVLHQVALWHPLLAQLPGIDAASAAGAAAATADTSICASSRQEQQQQVVAPHQGEALARQVLALRLGEGAAALSQGQQQLLALGRVLLWRPLLLVLDEATSSVDPGTANVMHEVIRRHLAGTTIIEVAHRQSTIARCSRVVVMEAGRVAEER